MKETNAIERKKPGQFLATRRACLEVIIEVSRIEVGVEGLRVEVEVGVFISVFNFVVCGFGLPIRIVDLFVCSLGMLVRGCKHEFIVNLCDVRRVDF